MSAHEATTMPSPSSNNKTSVVSGTSRPEPSQAELQKRIITHMNADHASSLDLYLRYFGKVPASRTHGAKLVDITSRHMVIDSAAGRNLVSFDPPMNSLAEARERVITMHHQALAGLGMSDTKINKWVPPNQAWQAIIYVLVVLSLATFPFPEKLLPESGSLASKIWSLGGLVPANARLAHRLNPQLLIGIFVVHTAEAALFAQRRLKKHQVPTGSAVWWMWVASTWVGGIASFRRFDDYVKQVETAKKKDAKH